MKARRPWNEPNWKDAYGPVPEGYYRKVDRTLNDIKEGEPVDKKIAAGTLLIAALICLLVAGTALALSNAFGIMDFLDQYRGLKPKEDAAAYIKQALGSSDNGLVRLTIREAVYDGATVRAVMAMEALEPDKYVIIDKESSDGQIAYVDDAHEETIAQYAQRTGRSLVDATLVVSVDNVEDTTGSYVQARDGDALIVYAEIHLNGQSPARASLVAYLDMLDLDEYCGLSYELERTQVDTAVLTPEDSSLAGLNILSVKRTDTPFATYLQVVYEADRASREAVAAHFDSGATYYATEFGHYAHLDPNCSGMAGAHAVAGSDVRALGKNPCPKCTGTDLSALFALPDWRFAWFAADKQPLYIVGFCGGDQEAGVLTDAYIQTYVAKTDAVPQGGLYIKPLAPAGESLPFVHLRAT